MKKRLLFVCAVVLFVSSAANAGAWGWLRSIVFPVPAPGGQAQVGLVSGVGGVVGQGAYDRNTWATNTQSTSQGTQSSTVVAHQSSSVTGSPGSYGRTFSTVRVVTYRVQSD